MSTGMKHSRLSAVMVAVIFATLMLGCDVTGPSDGLEGTSADEPAIAERLAECLATMFPQMSRDELEREAQMRMADAEAVKNAEAFVDQFCGNDQSGSLTAPTNGKVVASDTPASSTLTASASVNTEQSKPARGLGVTRSEMEEFFLAMVAEERSEEPTPRHKLYPVVFTLVGNSEGQGKITEVKWAGWENEYYKPGKYAALAGPDEDIYGIVFACDGCQHGKRRPIGVEWEFMSVVNRVATDMPDWYEPDRNRWVYQFFERRSCGDGRPQSGGGIGAGGGGELSNILPRSSRRYDPTPTPTPYIVVQDGVAMRLDCRAGSHILFIRAVDHGNATPN
ncbi:MAG: hypothetical protein OXL37_13420 [Chloroflexota bacterium]|nr:hypothetical protein [Chloroflexota bacterium]MDE2959257.1 hypothetical protein [Chloroflexota bacterium]